MQLDEYQQKAVVCDARFVRVLAGAGSGKTRTLIERIRQLLKAGVKPNRILAVTFSRKAANEMRARLRGIAGVDICTLHALGYRILRSQEPTWGVAEEADKRRLIRKALVESKSPMKFSEAPKVVSTSKRELAHLEHRLLLVAYERLKREAQVWDFDDMLVEADIALQDPVARRDWQRWDHILVDETQDTDVIQWSLLEKLVGPSSRLFVVGDVSQSIYGWRGAMPYEMLDGIDLRFGPFAELQLPCNYRSVRQVVELANAVVDGKEGGLSLQHVREDPGEIEWVCFDGGRDEAQEVLDRLKNYRHFYQLKWQDMAILYRTNAQSERFENILIKNNVPYEIAGNWSFYSRAEVKDVIAYLRLSQEWHAESLDRIFNRPSRYLGRAFYTELRKQGGWEAVPAWWKGEKHFEFSRPYMHDRFYELVQDVADLQNMAKEGATPVELVDFIYNSIGYKRWLQGEEPDAEDECKVENLEMLREAVEDAGHLQSILDIADRAQALNKPKRQPEVKKDRGVQLLTVHRAKGLEWPVVFLVGCNQYVMPHIHGEPDEEERVFYVAITRARDRLVVTSSGMPSPLRRFVCPDEYGPEVGVLNGEAESGSAGWDEDSFDEEETWLGGTDSGGGDEPTDECSRHLQRGS